MVQNTPPARRINGIRNSIPQGYILGRASGGEGDVELLSLARMKAVGMASTTLPPSGPAGGDLGGTYPNPSVLKLRGILLNTVAPTSGQVLAYDGTKLTYATPHYIPAGGTTGQVLTKINGTDYNVDWETPSGGGSSSIPASIVDNGTNILLAITDPDGFVVTNPDSSPILATEVFPVASLANAVSLIQSGTWVPTDHTGSGITFSGVTTSWAKFGNLCFLSLTAVVSVNASGTRADIGGIPAAILDPAGADRSGVGVIGAAGLNCVANLRPTGSPPGFIYFFNPTTAGTYTWAQLSGSVVMFNWAYSI